MPYIQKRRVITDDMLQPFLSSFFNILGNERPSCYLGIPDIVDRLPVVGLFLSRHRSNPTNNFLKK